MIPETLFVWIVTGLYLAQGVVSAAHGNWPFVVIFSGYAFANLGMIWGMR